MRTLLLAAVPLTAVLLTACGAPVAEPPVPQAGPTATDLAFLELVIPQNESALAVLELAGRREDSALRPVTDQVVTGYRTELARARELLTRAGRQETDLHDGHDMPGMITAAELASIGDSRGSEFDQRLRTLLRTQFEEARTVARAELSGGTSPPVLELGTRIERTRAEFLALL
ncbi:hypothetical protein BBK82_34015 [Lentzea guizhouensis]|uniref:DUF305 domain-containing protein n=1 Tax=Lentzea guizhouensis TaxID=1586287 RepID=A0A1B2HRH0_9PSEU|nr:DUF305 domain-containing protein [Lentzea guizhouensis]ANZ40303.1 hypothetical protein BBK82_34015 [Lentzea guizhouensis]